MPDKSQSNFDFPDGGIARLQALVAAISKPAAMVDSIIPSPWLDELAEGATRFSRVFDELTRSLESSLAPLAELVDQLGRGWRIYKLFDEAGWLPHYTFPFSMLGDDLDAATLDRLLTDYYGDNWSTVSHQFAAHLGDQDVDDEAKATFLEALALHGQGHYRATPRLLFPEIERIARAELHQGSLNPITSLREMRQAAGDLGAGEMLMNGEGIPLALFSKMTDHLYAPVKTFEDLARMSVDPVPNRHAALHGLVVYKTRQNSLNALIMTEFMYRVVTALKQQQGAEAE